MGDFFISRIMQNHMSDLESLFHALLNNNLQIF